MATTEDVIILKVGTDEAVKSVNDLKSNIKMLKKDIETLEVGTEEYQSKLKELNQNQNALRDVMHATSSTMEEVAAAAKGATNSYNSLVNQMASLKKEWRSTNDVARRNELGQQIAAINDQLKEMDASVGNFQRNVGNYESGFSKFGEILKELPPTLGSTKEELGKVGETMMLVGKQPILGIIGLIAPIIMEITEKLKQNETAMDSVKNLMKSLEPVFNVVKNVIQVIAEGFATAVNWLAEFIGQSVGLSNVVSSITGVGNALLQWILTPIRTIVSAFSGLGTIMKDIFTGKFDKIKEDASAAWSDVQKTFSEGIDLKQNFDEGKQLGANFIEGVKATDNIDAAKDAGTSLGEAFNEGWDEELAEDDAEAFWAGVERQRESLNNWLTEKLRLKEEAAAREAAMEKAVAEAAAAEIKALEDKKTNDIKEEAQKRIAILDASASGISSIFSALADVYESDEKNSEKNAQKIKNLRIASATIDMLQGVVAALSSAAGGGPAGWIAGAAQAAVITATGIANINKIKSTNPSGSAAPAASSAPAVVSAPNIDTGLSSVRTLTTASEEERLNRMAEAQRVYVLQSDIEAAGERSRVRVAESSF